jgi:hypothetical protein
MKLTVFAQKQINEETTIALSKAFDASMLKDKTMLKQLADKIQGEGFPEKFSLPVKLSNGADLVMNYELYEKAINDAKSHHQVTFTYEHARDTVVAIRSILKQAEKDDEDDDGDKYDTLYEELKHDIIHVTAEFAEKFTKVWATTE